MRKVIFLALLFCLRAGAQQFAAYWSPSDFILFAPTSQQITITPQWNYTVFGSNMVTGATRSFSTGTKVTATGATIAGTPGTLVVSNMIPGGYKVQFFNLNNPIATATVTNVFTNGTPAFVNAKDFIGVSTNTPFGFAYTIAQANAAFDASGASTNTSVPRTYYVGPNGNDSWSGSELQPFATILHAANVTSNNWLVATNLRQVVHVLAGDHTNDMNAGQRIRFQDYVDLIGEGGNYLELTNFNSSAVGGSKIRLGSHGHVRNMNIKDHDASGGTEAVFGFYGADGTSDNGRSYVDDFISGCTMDGDSQLFHIEGNTTGDSIQYEVRDCTFLSDYNPVQIKNQTLPPLIEVTFFGCHILQTNRSGKAFNKPSCCIAGSNIGSGLGHSVKFVSCTFSYSDANTATNAYFFFDNGIGGDVSGFSFTDSIIGPLSATNNATTADFNSLNAASVVRDGGLRHADGTPLTVWNGTAVVPVAVNGGAFTNLNATNLVGTIQLPSIPSAVVTNTETGVTLSGTLSGNGSGLTNLLGGIPTLNTNFGTSTLVTSEAIQGKDRAFMLGFLLSGATQQALSNYFPITLSQTVSTNPVIATLSMQNWGTWTNSVSGNTAPNVRFVAVCTSNTVTIQSAAGAVPTASSMEAISVHVDQP